MTVIVNEGTTSYATAKFYDKDAALALPTTVSYRIDCITSGTEIKAGTAITAANTVEVTITDEENAIIDQTKAAETRVVTFTATYGVGEAATEEYQYSVKNLHGIT